MKQNKVFDLILTTLKGIVMGVSETIPGVSSSTIALILNIYEKYVVFLDGLVLLVKTGAKLVIGRSTRKDFVLVWKEVHAAWGFFLLGGIVVGAVLFSRLAAPLVENYPSYVAAFLFGMVVPAARIPFKRIKKLNATTLLIVAGTFLVFSVLLSFRSGIVENPSPLFLVIGGFLAGAARILPGVSGTFVLLLMGVYEFFIGALSELPFPSVESFWALFYVGVGLLIGFITIIRFLKQALVKYPDILMAVLVGLILASLRTLWPFVSSQGSYVWPWDLPANEMIIILGLIVLSFVSMVLIISKTKKNG